jgi:chromosomal replication initiation ATPase DnaA
MKPSIEELEQRDLLQGAQRIARSYRLSLAEMFSKSRTRPAPEARAAFYRELRELGWSYPRIGELVGKDHTSVLDAVRAHEAPEAAEERP